MTAAARRAGPRLGAALLLVWAVAWSVPAGRISEDTKNDLYVDPWGFMARAAHLWDPQVTWGVLQNQGYGYLFPMGPFFGLIGEVVPVWVTQRLWWSLVLTVGLLATYGLLRTLRVGRPTAQVVAALAYTLSPRVLSTIGGLSSEALPVLLAPAILLPVVLATQGRIGPRRAAALSAVAVLCCGGVNASATILATVPAGLWLLTRGRWWRAGVTWWWAGAVVVATAWWLGPVLVLGRWSPPFLDWIERSADVVREIDLLDVARGTTHWLGFVVTSGGEWWPAGYTIATGPVLVVATAVLAGTSLAGLALRGLPERRFLLVTLGVGVFLLAIAHTGPVSSPFAPTAQALLDGPLVAFRNIHKADPLVRLPLAVGLTVAVERLVKVLAGRSLSVRLVAAAAGGLVVLVVVSPGLSGAIAPRGTFPEMARQWRQAGAWLSDHADDGRALVVPASSFGEYDWGRTIDEPIRPLSSVDYAVRDAVPLTPAGIIRLLDAVEERLQTGRDVKGAAQVLRRLGVRHLVLRNDLDTASAGQPSVTFARSAIRSTPGIALARGFGTTRIDASGERVFPVEVYDIGPAAPMAVTQPVTDVVAVSGGPEDLLAVADAGMGGLTVLDGDHLAAVDPGLRVVTDGYRARERWFGATRGRDTSSTLTADEVEGTRDYRPWDDLSLHSVAAFDGVAAVTASSSLATYYTLAGLRPADRPAAAVDGDPTTAWVTQFDPRPVFEMRLDRAREVGAAKIRVLTDRDAHPGLGVPSELAVRTDGGVVRVDVPESGQVEVALPAGATSSVAVEVLDTARGDPSTVLTGLADVQLDDIAVQESVVAPGGRAEPADGVLLSGGLSGSDGCVHPEEDVICFGEGGRDPEGGVTLSRRFTARGGSSHDASGTLVPSRWAANLPDLAAPGVTVTASSSRTTAPAARPEAVVDADERTAWSPAADDTSPTIMLALDEPVDVDGVTLSARRGWMARYRPFVEVRLDDRVQVVRASADGRLVVRGDDVSTVAVTVLSPAGRDRAAAVALELEELGLVGHDLPRPAEQVTRPCGQGPAVEVDGTTITTRLDGPRSAMWGQGDLAWTACGPVVLGPGLTHSVVVRGDEVLRPATVTLLAEGTDAGAAVEGLTAVPVTSVSPAHVTGSVSPGPQRLLALAINHNPGWEATLDGVALTPAVVDGFRQGFVLPDGVTGSLDVVFAPDAAYRWALGMGLLLVLLLLPALLVPDRRRRVVPAATGPRETSPTGVVVTALGFAFVVAGPWAALAAAVALGALCLRQKASDARVAVVVALLVTGAGVLVAATDPAYQAAPWVEATASVAVIAAGVLAGAAPFVRPIAWREARRRRGSARRETG